MKSFSTYFKIFRQHSIVFFVPALLRPGLLPVLGPLGSGTDATHFLSPALWLKGYQRWGPLYSISQAAARNSQINSGKAFAISTHWLTANAWGIFRKGIAAPGTLQFELRQSVSTSERSIYHTQAGFEPTEAE